MFQQAHWRTDKNLITNLTKNGQKPRFTTEENYPKQLLLRTKKLMKNNIFLFLARILPPEKIDNPTLER
jgi:hypothetical protein